MLEKKITHHHPSPLDWLAQVKYDLDHFEAFLLKNLAN
jgi:hypothetical protein